jgi:hypothetical protein
LKPELADPPPDGMFPAAFKEGTMAEAKLAPNLPDWMVEHANRYLTSGGTDGHMYKITVPGRGEITAPALLLTTTGRKSGDKFIFPLFYGTDGGSYFVIASKGGAPQHPGWYRNILATVLRTSSRVMVDRSTPICRAMWACEWPLCKSA